jgi:predicted DNA-binding protein with PD1-like motif
MEWKLLNHDEKTYAVIFEKGDEFTKGLKEFAKMQNLAGSHFTANGTTLGGHILEAHIWPTLELVVVESPKHLQRQYDEETGLALISVQ